MNNDLNADFDILFRQTYKPLGIKWLDGLGYTDSELIDIMNNFKSLFPEIVIINPPIILLKVISSVIHSNSIELTKNEVYDYFIISYRFLIDSMVNTKNSTIVPLSSSSYNIVLDLCNDLLANYEKLDMNTKIQIPSLLVDLLSILFFKTDLYGKKIPVFQLRTYYESKKKTINDRTYSYPLKTLKAYDNTMESINLNDDDQLLSPNNTKPRSGNNPIYLSKKRPTTHLISSADSKIYRSITDEMVFRLAQITQRNPVEVRTSLLTLPENEIQKLFDLCINYDKIQKYGKFINLKDFKLEIESELGRPLSEKQIRHSQISIKKIRFYVESILDGTFQPHMTHGINHVKHNFEYGYRLVGLFNNLKPRRTRKLD